MQPIDQGRAGVAGGVGGEADLQALRPEPSDDIGSACDRRAALADRYIEVDHDALNAPETSAGLRLAYHRGRVETR